MALSTIGMELTINGTSIGAVKELEGPGIVNEEIEVTAFDSASGYKEFILGPKTLENIKGTVWYTPTNSTHNASTGLAKFANSGESVTWAVIFSDVGNTTWTGSGFVKSFIPKAGGTDDALEAEFEIMPTGAPTLA
jgi:hypothetical protein